MPKQPTTPVEDLGRFYLLTTCHTLVMESGQLTLSQGLQQVNDTKQPTASLLDQILLSQGHYARYGYRTSFWGN